MFLWFLTLASLLTVPSAIAGTTVVGTGIPDEDVINVREAINEGGTVLLRGFFHFGDETTKYTGGDAYLKAYGFVDILNGVEIVGENATIYGGVGPFWVETPGSDVIIKGSDKNNRLTFADALWAAIVVVDCESLTIKNVDIDGVNSLPYFENEEVFGERYGIRVGYWGPSPPDIPLRIGKLSIVGCNIDLGSYEYDYEHGTGIFTWGIGTPENEVEILIKGNTVRNCSLHGMGLFNIAGTLSVKGNIMRPGNKAFPYWEAIAANGIWALQTVGWPFDLPGGYEEYQSDWVSAVIKNNDIHCEPNTFDNDARAIAILALRQVGTVIKNNNIRVDGGLFCIVVDDGSDGFTVKRNICSGSDLVGAIGVGGSAKNCKIKNNDFSAATPLEAQVSIQKDANNISVIKNYLGPGGDAGGIYCAGFNNKIFYNAFHGDYPGWPDNGFLFLDEESHDNRVSDLRQATYHSLTLCELVKDLGTNNKISGYRNCTH